MALRKMTENDLEMVLQWRNAPEVRENMYNNQVISLDEHKKWFQKTLEDKNKKYFIYEKNAEPLGVIAFTDINLESETAAWAFYVGELSKRGAGVQMEKEALRFAFNDLKLNKLWCEVLSFNEKVIKFHQRFGFQVEGVFKSQYKRDNEFYDIYRLALFKQDWKSNQRIS